MKDFFNSNYGEDDQTEAADSYSQQINLPQFNEIDFDTYIFSINVHAGSCYRASILGEGQKNVKVDVVGQKLVIREKKTNKNNFKKKHVYSKSPLIIITIPEGTELIRIKAKISAGSATLVQLTMQELDLNLLAGSTKLTNVVIKKHAKATFSAGSLTLIEDAETNYDISSSLGTITYHGERKGHRFCNGVSGNDELIAKVSAGSIKIK